MCPPIKKLRNMKIPVALGTNGTSSLHSLSLWDEIRYIRDHYPETEKPTPEELLEMATLEGARGLGLEKQIGSLEVGKDADCIALRIPSDIDLADIFSWLVSHITEREVVAVFVEGKRIKV